MSTSDNVPHQGHRPCGEPDLPADAEVLAMAELLDTLGEHERAAAPVGFEERVVAASRGRLEGPRPIPLSVQRTPQRGSGAWLAGARLAASVSLIGAAAAVWVASRGPVSSSRPDAMAAADPDEVAVEALLAAASFDSSLSGLDYEIDLLFADTATFDASAPDEPGIDPLLEEDSL